MRQLLFAFLLLFASPAFAKTLYLSDGAENVAVNGYDVVAYHTLDKPVEGSAEFTHSWEGATWHFSSAENRDLFAADPGSYAPQFGGWCAWAVSRGYLAGTDPHAFDVVDGKLYLNYSKSVRLRWRVGRDGNIRAGESRWPGLIEAAEAKSR